MKTSNFFTIVIVLVIIVTVPTVILSVENIGMKNNHGSSHIPENDLYCGTEWTVQMKESLDFKIFERFLREEIAEFGSSYDLSQRYIVLEDLGENRVRIEIGGLWTGEPGRPNLTASIEEIDFVDYVEDFSDLPFVAWCY